MGGLQGAGMAFHGGSPFVRGDFRYLMGEKGGFLKYHYCNYK